MFKLKFLTDLRRFAPEGDGAGAGDPAPAATPDPAPAAAVPDPAPAAAADPAPAAAKWWQDTARFDPETQKWLTARGLTVDDPLEILPKVIQGHRNAESRLGKGVDSIMDRPAKGQAYGDWARANAEALGLPADTAGYEVKPPADWPKDLPWDSAAEAAVRDIALKHGVPPEAHQAYVAFQANALRELAATTERDLAKAHTDMNNDLRRDWGDQLEAKKTGAIQAAQFIAEKAGITAEGIQALSMSMAEKIGDAGVLRVFSFLSEQMADDSGLAMGRGQQSLGTTPAEARAELAKFEGPEGEYGKAFKAGDQVKLEQLRPRRQQLLKLAAG